MDAYKTEDVETFVSHASPRPSRANGGIFPLVDPVSARRSG